MTMRVSRLSWAIGFAVTLFVGTKAVADSAPVPGEIQAKLAAGLLSFDRGLAERAGGAVRVLILTDAADGESQRIANEFAAGMKAKATIAGMPVEVSMGKFESPSALAARVKKDRLSAVYLSKGLARETEGIAGALDGSAVMTIAAEPSAVIRGAVIGFDLLSGRPKILVNLRQAKAQKVELPASVLLVAWIEGGEAQKR